VTFEQVEMRKGILELIPKFFSNEVNVNWPLQLLWKSLTLQQNPIAKNKKSSLDGVVVEFYTTY